MAVDDALDEGQADAGAGELRTLSGFSEALLEDYADALGEEGRDYAGRIAEASEQMATLIDDLLRLSRITRAEVHPHSVDPGAEAGWVAAELQRGDPGRRVSFAIQQPVQVQADPGLIRTVLQNLLENAWKFTSDLDDASIEFSATRPGTDTCLLRARQRRRFRPCLQ